MGNLFEQIVKVFQNLFNSKELMEVLKEPEITTAAFIALTLIIFTETGLLIGFFLPGDSLLVTVGIVAWNADWSLPLLMIILSIAAIVGDTVGYWIGAKAGVKLYERKESFFFRKSHLLVAQKFYEKHGGKTIILARFVPIVRTFAPVVAGISRMNYRRFLMFNVVGGISWIVSMLTVGYLITPFVDPFLRKLFGPEFRTADHAEKLIIIVVFLSILPAVYATLKEWLKARKERFATLPPVTYSQPEKVDYVDMKNNPPQPEITP
ncbi:MAG: VTT domain-containing protein [Gemmataceae bacterium]|jgi:membrane-associated protein|nr:VTT domain-containing protein [Gemmataceae bacterium]